MSHMIWALSYELSYDMTHIAWFINPYPLILKKNPKKREYPGASFLEKNIQNIHGIGNGSQLKNPDISGAPYTLRIQYSYTQSQCEDGARDVRLL